MAKRGIVGHPKIVLLADSLRIMEPFAVGIVEVFWQWVAKYKPTGDLTGVRPSILCRSIRYSDDPDALWEALIEARFLDQDGEKFTVHDWSHHADDSVHMHLGRAKLLFADGSQPSLNRLSKQERAEIEKHYMRTESAQEAHSVRTESAQEAHKLGKTGEQKANTVRTRSAPEAHQPLPLPLPLESQDQDQSQKQSSVGSFFSSVTANPEPEPEANLNPEPESTTAQHHLGSYIAGYAQATGKTPEPDPNFIASKKLQTPVKVENAVEASLKATDTLQAGVGAGIPSTGLEPAGEGHSRLSPDPDTTSDLAPRIEAMLMSHPRPEYSARLELLVFRQLEKVQARDSINVDAALSYLEGRMELYAASVANWPEGERQYANGIKSWFENAVYRQNENVWKAKERKSYEIDYTNMGRAVLAREAESAAIATDGGGEAGGNRESDGSAVCGSGEGVPWYERKFVRKPFESKFVYPGWSPNGLCKSVR